MAIRGRHRRPATWLRVLEVLESHRRSLARRRGVCGFGVGLALVGRRPTEEPAIRVHVRQKLPGLRGTRALPRHIDGVRVDVIETTFRALSGCPSSWPHERRDPLKGGVAIATDGSDSFGTLSACGRDVIGRHVGLTAGHVVREIGETVRQPRDGGRVGRVTRRTIDAHVDVARFELGADRKVTTDVRGIRITGVLDPVPLPDLGLPVRVVGACSGFREGLITGIEAESEIDYGDQIVVAVDHYLMVSSDGAEITRGGDSGALVLERDGGRLIGMVRAGEPDGAGDYALVARIRTTLDAVDVTLG